MSSGKQAPACKIPATGERTRRSIALFPERVDWGRQPTGQHVFNCTVRPGELAGLNFVFEALLQRLAAQTADLAGNARR
jgi:hypothetical protein